VPTVDSHRSQNLKSNAVILYEEILWAWREKNHFPLKRRWNSTGPHGVTPQKIALFTDTQPPAKNINAKSAKR
jgi:hypothetical protein